MIALRTLGAVLLGAAAIAPWTARAQTRETYTATAVAHTAGGAAATAPITITVDRKMSESEAAALAAAFKAGGAAALRKALDGVPPTGTITLAGGAAISTRLTLERATDKGRLLTIVTTTPILFLGAGIPGAKAKAGYDFSVLDIELDATGSGTGTLATAARISVKEERFVVEDYASGPVQITGIRLVR